MANSAEQKKPSPQSTETEGEFIKRVLAKLQSNWPEHPMTPEIAKGLKEEFVVMVKEYGRARVEKACLKAIREGIPFRGQNDWNIFPKIDELRKMAERESTGYTVPKCTDCDSTGWRLVADMRVTKCHCRGGAKPGTAPANGKALAAGDLQ